MPPFLYVCRNAAQTNLKFRLRGMPFQLISYCTLFLRSGDESVVVQEHFLSVDFLFPVFHMDALV